MTTLLEDALDNYELGLRYELTHIRRGLELERETLRTRIKELGFWFVDVPRTSSTFIKQNLATKLGYPFGKTGTILGFEGSILRPAAYSSLLPDHTPAFQAKKILDEELWFSIKTFSVVRNPYAWCWSLWRFVEERQDLGFVRGSFQNFLTQLEVNLVHRIGERRSFPSDLIQSDYILDPDSGEIIVNRLIRFEDREAIIELLAEHGISDSTPDRPMASTGSYVGLTESEKKIIHRICARDFDLLGY